MIIPIRCFTCNRVLASKYIAYKNKIDSNDDELLGTKSIETLVDKFKNAENEGKKFKTKTQRIFEEIGIGDRYCCKRHILSHIDLIEKI